MEIAGNLVDGVNIPAIEGGVINSTFFGACYNGCVPEGWKGETQDDFNNGKGYHVTQFYDTSPIGKCVNKEE